LGVIGGRSERKRARTISEYNGRGKKKGGESEESGVAAALLLKALEIKVRGETSPFQ